MFCDMRERKRHVKCIFACVLKLDILEIAVHGSFFYT